jgi:hypothetical protein
MGSNSQEVRRNRPWGDRADMSPGQALKACQPTNPLPNRAITCRISSPFLSLAFREPQKTQCPSTGKQNKTKLPKSWPAPCTRYPPDERPWASVASRAGRPCPPCLLPLGASSETSDGDRQPRPSARSVVVFRQDSSARAGGGRGGPRSLSPAVGAPPARPGVWAARSVASRPVASTASRRAAGREPGRGRGPEATAGASAAGWAETLARPRGCGGPVRWAERGAYPGGRRFGHGYPRSGWAAVLADLSGLERTAAAASGSCPASELLRGGRELCPEPRASLAL